MDGTIFGYPWISRGEGEPKYYYETSHELQKGVAFYIWEKQLVSPPHVHGSVEFVYCIEGKLAAKIGGERFILEPGQCAAVSSFVSHEFYSSEKVTAYTVILPPCLPGYEQMLKNRSFARAVMTDDGGKTLLSLFRLMKTVRLRDGAASSFDRTARDRVLHGLSAALIELTVSQCGLKESAKETMLIADALGYLHAHYREEIRVPSLARRLGYSQQEISDRFMEVFGMTVLSYVNHLRACDVRARLDENAGMTLEEAASLAGFGSMRSMLRAYRKEYGCTPSENRPS